MNLRIGLLNMMADGALRATERQFQRLLLEPGPQGDASALVAFSLDQLERSPQARDHIRRHYTTFAQVRRQGLDALVITGINLSDPRLDDKPFWQPLQEVMAWARAETRSVLCSCLATHAYMQFAAGQRRRPLGAKLWGVYRQRVLCPEHPLMHGLPAEVAVPHSRHNDITAHQFRQAGLEPLLGGGGAGVHVAAREDGALVLLQGHPEYDTISLLKEYKREVARFHDGHRADYPPLPENTLAGPGAELAAEHRAAVQLARGQGLALPDFPEEALAAHLLPTWHQTAGRFFGNWVEGLRRCPE